MANVVEVRAVFAAKRQGLIGSVLRRGDIGDVLARGRTGELIDIDVKGFRSHDIAKFASKPRELLKLLGRFAVPEYRLLIDQRNLSHPELKQVVSLLRSANVPMDRVFIPKASSFPKLKIGTVEL